MMLDKLEKLFRLVMGITGVCETILGLSIVLFASQLQHYIATGTLYEPLYLRILGMMDFYIGVTYIQISRCPDRFRLMNRSTSYLRLGLSFVFFAEGFFILQENVVRMMYQSLAFFDLFLFVIQTFYLRKKVER